MYYALRKLKVKTQSGDMSIRERGDALPEAYGWKENVIAAHLNESHMEERLGEGRELPEENSAILEEESDIAVGLVVLKKKLGRPKKVKELNV